MSTTPRAGRAVYVFGIGRDLDVAGLPRLPGGDHPRVVTGAGVRAVVADVDTATLNALADPAHEDLELLADAAHVHDATLALLAASDAVLPLRLGTWVPDDEAVRRLLDRHAVALQAELGRLTGHAEWAVRVHADDVRSPSEATVAMTSGPAGGRAYLERRRLERDARSDRAVRRAALARAVHQRLAAVSAGADRVSVRPLDEAEPPLHHGVYLVADDRRERFVQEVDALRGENPGAHLELTGPWPPYHFTQLSLGTQTASAP